jgi:hypothetical protein
MAQEFPPMCGTDLERWRLGNGLSKAMAADAFGLQKTKWDELTHISQSSKVIDDPVVAMLLHLYLEYPESAPIQEPLDIREFYGFLGLRDTPQDREKFAILIGRSAPSVYRLLLHDGKPGRPLVKWIEAVRKLRLSPKKSLIVMEEVASNVGDRQHIDNVLHQGWKRQNGSDDDA